MVVKANTITVNKKEYENMCKALVAETKECERLKELNQEMVEVLKRASEVIIEYQSGITAEYLIEIIAPVLAKAEEES